MKNISIMKKHLILAVVLLYGASAPLPAQTPVWFPLVGITGSGNNRDIIVIPDVSTNVLIFSNKLAVLLPVVLHPVGGNVTNKFLPWGYTVRVEGWPKSGHMVVPNTNTVQNAVNLMTGALAMAYPVGTSSGTSTNINNAAGSGLSLSGEIYTSSDLFNFTNAQTVFADPGTGALMNICGTQPVYDAGSGFYFGENFIFTNTSGLTYTVFNTTNPATALAKWNNYGTFSEFPFGTSGTSRYGINLSATNFTTWFYIQPQNTAASFITGVTIRNGANYVFIGYSGDGNYADLNVNVNGRNWLRRGADGTTTINDSHGNAALYLDGTGVWIGDGSGGISARLAANGTATGLAFTNAAGKSFTIGVNAATNGLTFFPK